MLALGIGASTVAFSVFYHLLIDPFSYRDSSKLITFGIRNVTNNGSSEGRDFFSADEFRELREQNRSFEDMVGYHPSASVLYKDAAGTRALPGMALVTGNTFDFYGVAPLLGRPLLPADCNPVSPRVFVMNYRLWETQFNRNPAVLGQIFVLNDEARVLVGIMPPRFDLYGAGIWVPLLEDSNEGALQIVARLKAGVSLRNAAADLDVIVHRLTENEHGYVLNPERYTVKVESLLDQTVGGFEKALYGLLAAALMLLMIACANVASLLLARATIREREIAVRCALGATPGRVFGFAFIESLMISAAGCLCGVLLAFVGLRAVVAAIPRGTVPTEAVIALDSRALLFALAIGGFTAFLCGLAPAIHSVSRDLATALAAGGVGRIGFRHQTLCGSLVIAESALSLVLLVGGGLFMRNFLDLTRQNLPFNPARTLYAELALPRDRYYGKRDEKPAFFRELLPRIKALPGVISVTESLMLPPNEGAWTDVMVPGKPHTERWVADLELCSEGYFQTLGLSLLRGRLLAQSDLEQKRFVAVVNETLVRKYFNGEDPIGKKIKFEVFDRPFVDAPHNTYFEIVGVVADFKSRPERREYALRPEAFLPATTAGFGSRLHVVAKTAVDPHSLLKSVSLQVWSVDPDAAISESGSLADLLREDFRGPRFEFMILGTFAAIGLVLVSIGVFSVMTFSVSSRTREIGVRMALGAERSGVLRMVLQNGLRQLGAGVLIGLIISVALTRLIRGLLWGVSASDPWVLCSAVVVLLLVGLGASLLPALRAASTDPLIALRCE